MPRHTDRKHLPYTAEQMFDLVADIERYPEFLPFVTALRVRKREGNTITADLSVGWKMIREHFVSTVTLDRPGAIQVEYIEGPLKYLHNRWSFTGDETGCVVDFYVDFEFRSRSLQALIGGLFNELVRREMGAFETRAHQVYGPPARHRPTPTAEFATDPD